MQTFDQHLLDLLRANKISVETALAAASNPTDFQTKLALEGDVGDGGSPGRRRQGSNALRDRLRRAVLAVAEAQRPDSATSSARARSSPARCAARRRRASRAGAARAAPWCSPASAPPRPSARRLRALRAAAGFDAPDAARAAAEALGAALRDGDGRDEEQRARRSAALPRPARRRAASGSRPSASRAGVHGALLVGAPAAARARRAPERSSCWRARSPSASITPSSRAASASSRRAMSARERADGREERRDPEALRGALRPGHRAAAQQREARQDREAQERLHREDVARAAHAAQRHHRVDHRGARRRERRALRDRAKASACAARSTTAPRSCARSQNILDLWRIKQGELPVEIQDVNFREVVEEAIFSVQDAIGDKPSRDREALRGAAAEDPHRPREGQPDPVPAARQRGRSSRRDGRIDISRARRGRRSWSARCGTPASGSAPTTSSSSSTSSTRSTTWPRRSTAARASASRWCAIC